MRHRYLAAAVITRPRTTERGKHERKCEVITDCTDRVTHIVGKDKITACNYDAIEMARYGVPVTEL